MIKPPCCPHCGSTLDPARLPGRSGEDSGHASKEADGLPPPIPPETSLAQDRTGPDLETGESSIAVLGIELGNETSPPVPNAFPDEEAGASGHPSPDDHDDRLGERGSAWPVALLASYASAMTIACVWLWWTGHREDPGPDNRGRAPDRSWSAGLDAAGVDGPIERTDPGRRTEESGLVSPLEPIAEGARVTLGETLRIDALELTPLDVTSGPVRLHRIRVDGRPEHRPGGVDALHLRVQLRNASDDVVFAPLDEAFVREPDRQLPETFIEDGDGHRVYAYRLPVASEWSILGQDFGELRPGEAMETIIVSDTDAPPRLNGPLTWRLRLRTSPGMTTVVGVSIEASVAEAKSPSSTDG